MVIFRLKMLLFLSYFITACESSSPLPLELSTTEELHPDANYPNLVLGGCHYTDGEFKMMIQGLSLGVRTPVVEPRKGAVVKKGNYLHLVFNDSLHSMHFDRNVRINIPDGQYKASAFVARDYHESVKNEQAFMCREIKIRDGEMVRSIKSNEARLVYGAPWGIFKNEEIDDILFDFFLINTSISPEGNKVRLTIDQQKEFLIEEWESHYIKGLGLGKHTIQIELLNAEGTRIYGPLKQEISCVLEEE